MKMFGSFKRLLNLTQSQHIARRYFVVNGFDGTLAILGLTMGFLISETQDIRIMISACLGTAIALGVSGVSSAYISEVAENKREMQALEQAMLKNLAQSTHGKASIWVPFYIALINGSSPFLFALLVMMPLWMHTNGMQTLGNPLWYSIAIAFLIVFLLGAYLGHISQTHWLLAGLRTLLIAFITAAIIWLIGV